MTEYVIYKSDSLQRIGVASDHAGFALNEYILKMFIAARCEVIDFELNPEDDYLGFVIPLARAVASGELQRGIAVCGSGVGACVAANKITGVRAALINDHFSAHQGVEDDDMNLIFLGGRVTAFPNAEELITSFLNAKFSGAERHLRRLQKIRQLKKN
jgi:ribose 5-phosphate isomerase B